MMGLEWVVAVRAAVPSPRPQAWQALQQAVGLARSGQRPVHFVADAGLPGAVPADPVSWLGAELPAALVLHQGRRWRSPPTAGLLFRYLLSRLVSRQRVLLCRDPRVAAAQAGWARQRWAAVVMEWHVQPQPQLRSHRLALKRADLHLTPAPGLLEDLHSAGVSPERTRLVPNACGLDRVRASRRAAREAQPGGPVLAMGLHRRDGLELALSTWQRYPQLPELWIAGRDQGSLRYHAWMRRIETTPGLRSRIKLLGPCWGAEREDLLDQVSSWLCLYPEDLVTRTRLCPLQVMDAAGSGLPIVCSELDSVRWALGDHPALTVQDSESLAAAVLAVQAGARPKPEQALIRPRWEDRGQELRSLVTSAWRAA